MPNFNKVLIMGRLTRDVELRYTPNGTAVGSFGIATSRRFKTKEGDQKEDVCFVEVVVWARQAETCAEYLAKGSGAFIDGHLQLDQWETPEGQKRSRIKVVGDRVIFLGKPKSSEQGQETPGKSDEDDIPF